MNSLEGGPRGPGRPTINDEILIEARDGIVWLLSVSWGDIGWQLPRVTTLNELAAALEPLRGHANEQYVTVFLRSTFVVTRFSCTGDVLCVERTVDGWRVAIVELKEGEVNDAIREARKARAAGAWSKFFKTYGEKGIQQARRVFKQEKEVYKREARIRATRGVYSDEDGKRVVLESEVPLDNFLPTVEAVCRKARKGQYAIEVVDGCLMVAAGDATSMRRAMLAEVDARLFALNAFGSQDMAKESPEKIAKAMDKVTLVDWLDGLGAISLVPLCLRPLSAHTFLDLAFGRIRLLFFFHPPAFIELLQAAGIKAQLLSVKETNRLRTTKGLRASDLPPLHEGRTISYYMKGSLCYVGSMRFHEMVFNWARPRSLVAQMADAISTAPAIPKHSSETRTGGGKPTL